MRVIDATPTIPDVPAPRDAACYACGGGPCYALAHGEPLCVKCEERELKRVGFSVAEDRCCCGDSC